MRKEMISWSFIVILLIGMISVLFPMDSITGQSFIDKILGRQETTEQAWIISDGNVLGQSLTVNKDTTLRELFDQLETSSFGKDITIVQTDKTAKNQQS
ncbi:hypothetical protein CL622_02590, partial [archaeon]|nr:hypothetical protein [archaeon]